MARRDHDNESGEPFANISNRVAAGGTPDDVMVVQGLLLLRWKVSKTAQRLVPTEPPVDGAAHKSNTILIRQFQKEVMNRKEPPGFVNPATKFDGKSLRGSTIFMLNATGNFILISTSSPHENTVEFLVANFPKLAGPLGGPRAPSAPSGSREPAEPREAHLLSRGRGG